MNMIHQDAEISNFTLVGSSKRQIELSCFTAQDAALAIDLLDGKGRSFFHAHHRLGAGEHQLTIDLPQLPVGSYNAWISLADKTIIEPIVISKTRSKMNGLWSRLFGF